MPRAEQIGASTSSIPQVNLAWIHPFLEILEDVGAPYDEILRQAKLPVLAIEDGTAMVPTARIYEFVALAQRATGMSDLGFRAGHRIDIESLLASPEHSWSRPGIFRTLERFIDINLASTSHGDLWIEPKSDRERTVEFFYRGTFDEDNPAFSMVEQFMIALMVRFARLGAGPDWRPERVNLRATSVPERAIKDLVGDAEVRCAQTKTSLLFPSQRWDGRAEFFPEPTSHVWKRHRKSLEKWKQGDDLVGPLRLVLRAYLPDGSPGISLAAQLIGTTVRTLQRRLAKQGMTYSQLLDELRHDLAIYLLRDPNRKAAEVSRELGYRDPAIFTRAFRRWTGQTPTQFRSTLTL